MDRYIGYYEPYATSHAACRKPEEEKSCDRFTTLLVVLVTLAAVPAAGQSKPDPEVMNYTLSMEKLRKLVPAQRALNALYAKDPQFFDKIDRESKAAQARTFTVAEQAAILNRYEGFKRALASAGTTPREWLLISEAMGNAFVANEVGRGH